MEYSRIRQEADRVLDRVVSMYHDLHRIPELSLEEYETTEYIRERLKEMDIDSFQLDRTGCVAYIGPEPVEGHIKTVALRADIDGLPVLEETGLPFASCHEGKMHACGHDGHTASLLGAAMVLKKMENELPVRVKLIFQASEENTLGACRLLDKGVLDDVDEIFGLHLFSDIPTGTISLEEGPRMARTEKFEVVFTGKGGHGAKPHLAVDATVMAAAFVMDLQTLVSREIDPRDAAVVSIGSFQSGNQYNVISQEAVLEGTSRCYTDEISNHLEEGIRRKADSVAASFRGQARVTYQSRCHPPVFNDGRLTERILGFAKNLLDPDRFKKVKPLMGGEDFSWYQTKVPGVFALVGCGNPDQPVWQNHHGRFTIDEPALRDALMLHLSAVLSV